MTTATQQRPLTNKYAGRCQCGQDVPAGGGAVEKIGEKYQVRCGKCLGWPQPPKFKRGDKVRLLNDSREGEVALRCEAPGSGSRVMLIVKLPTVGSQPAKSVRVPEDDCSPAVGQTVVKREVVKATPQSDLILAAEDAVADVELAASHRVELPDYLVEAMARLDKAIRRCKESIK